MQLGLIDRVIEGDLLTGAVAFAREIADQGGALRKTRELNDKLGSEFVNASIFAAGRDQARKTRRNMLAPLKAVDAIEAAVNAAVRRRLQEGTRDLRGVHCFRSGPRADPRVLRRARRRQDPRYSQGHGRLQHPPSRASSARAPWAAASRWLAPTPASRVLLKEVEQAALDRGMATIRKNYENSVKKGRFSQEVMDQRMALIHPQLTYDGFEQADLIIEAVFESMELKKQIFGEIDKIAKPDCVLASNTSTLDIDEIASVTSRPQMVIGLHFFSPAQRHAAGGNRARQSDQQGSGRDGAGAGEEARQGGRGGGQLPRLRRQSHDAALHARGAIPGGRRRDAGAGGSRAHQFRHGDGHLRRGRYGRHRSGVSRAAGVQASAKSRACACRSCSKSCSIWAATARRRGAGWYRYDENRKPIADPEVHALIEKTAQEGGIARRHISDEEIIERCIYIMINEGAKILEEGYALRAADIDVIYLTGYGFPAYRGGPMWYADTVGLKKVRDRIAEFHEKHGELWEPAPLLNKLADAGETFAAWDMRSREHALAVA